MTRIPSTYLVALIIALLALSPIAILFVLASDSVQLFDTQNLRVLGNTLLLMFFSVIGASLIGVPLAILTTYVRLPWQSFWLILLVTPLALPSYLGAFTFYAAFGVGGEINNLFGIPTPSVNGLAGSALIMALYTYPFVLLTTRASLSNLDASQIYAARTLGMSMMASLWKVVLPRILNGIAAGALLVAMYALSDFGTPAIMNLDTFTRVIFVEYNAFGLSQAAMLSLQLLTIVTLILILESQFKGTKERPSSHLSFWPSRWQTLSLLTLIIPIALLSILLPLSVFFLWLWREGMGNFQLSLAWNSAYAALLAAVFAVLLALPVAYAALKGRFGRVVERLVYIGFGIPGIVMGTSLVYLGLKIPFLYQTLALLVIAYLLRFLPLAVGAIRSTTESIDSSLLDAARLLGSSKREAFKRITLPLTMRGIIAGAALVFLEVMRELPTTLMLGPIGFETLATYMWRVYEAGYFGKAAVPGLLLILISILALALMFYGERWGQIRQSKN